jgi:hypothetical protein
MAVAQAAPSDSEVTVYNQGFALVKENRVFDLKEGRQVVAVEDVASQIEANSVGIRSLTDPDSFEVLEQNYQFDLINPTAILNKAVGQKITLLRVLPDGKKESVTGTLMSSPTAIVSDQNGGEHYTFNGMVLKTDDGRILLNPSGEIQVDSIPEGMISKPTLLWDLVAKKAGENKVELSYITRGLTWNADYVLTLNSESDADLRGWVTMTNNSGTTYPEAKLKLLAGDVQTQQQLMAMATGFGGGMGGRGGQGFQEESLFEYHLYTLQRPATLKDKEIKQLSLLEGSGLKYEKKLIVDSMRTFGQYFPGEGEVGVGDLKPQVRIEFVNSKENNLGMPMPKGNVKVYQRDQSGSMQMLGEDKIDHTPKDEKISLVVGRSFDVVANRKRTNFTRLGPSETRESFAVEVKNHKDTAQQVLVWERHWGDWKVTEKNMDWKKLDAQTMEFTLDLKPNESKTVTYTIETKW